MAAERGRARGPRLRRLRPVRPGPRRRGGGPLAADGRDLVRTGSPYAVARAGCSRATARRTASTPRTSAPGGPRLARAGPQRGRRRPWLPPTGGQRWPDEPDLGALALPPPASGRPRPLGRVPAPAGSPRTPSRATAPTWRAPRRCPRPCAGARCTRAPCWPSLTDRAGPRCSARNWRGGSSTPMSSSTSPASARAANPRMAAIARDSGPAADRRFEAWCAGRTGYPFVDAGMRRCSPRGGCTTGYGWSSRAFLVRDLHLDWTRGARCSWRACRPFSCDTPQRCRRLSRRIDCLVRRPGLAPCRNCSATSEAL